MHTQQSLSCIYMYTIFIVHRKDCISVCFCWSLKVKATQVLQASFDIFERSLFLSSMYVGKVTAIKLPLRELENNDSPESFDKYKPSKHL